MAESSSSSCQLATAMKRKGTDRPPGTPKKQPRQNPVSCESCRKKKLKCDRTRPCSSCLARKIPCSYGGYGPAPTSLVVKPGSEGSDLSTGVNNGITRELRAPSRVPESQGQNTDDPLTTAEWLENFMMGHRVPSAVPAPFRDELAQRQRMDSPRPAHNPLLGSLSALILGGRRISLENPAVINLASFLPSKTDAMGFLQYYCNHLDWQYHLIIPGRTKTDIEDLYEKVARGEPFEIHHAALLFSMMATSLFFQLLSTETAEVAETCSRETAFLAGAALVQSDYVAYPTIQGLQASMIIMHHLSSLTLSPSISSLFLPGTSISQAKSLGLHVVDRPLVARDGKPSVLNRVDHELRRRLWWDLTSYDWLLGFLSGPQEHTYTIPPHHMAVEKPLHVEDEDLETSVSDVPLSIPTCMSYTLHRLKLAEVCREVVDESAQVHLRGQELSYEKLLDLDRKFHSAYAELPAFFRFDQSSRHQYASLYQDRPTMAWQRAFLQQAYHSRLCRLHRQFFIRGAKDPRYSYSHIVSLQSARKVLEVKRIMDEEEPLFSPNSSFFWTVMNHVFMAAVILLIDVCFNWDDILAEKRKEEVLDACRMLNRAQQSSSVAREGINAMMGILRKYWKEERKPLSQTLSTKRSPHSGSDYPTLEHRQVAPAPVNPVQLSLPGLSGSGSALEQPDATPGLIPLEDLWTEMLDESARVSLDTPDWMDMLTELTNTTAPCE